MDNPSGSEFSSASGGHSVRLLTWNIHGGVGRGKPDHLDRVVALIRSHEPDIVALQEVDSRRSRGRPPSFDILCEALGEHRIAAKAITAPDGEYGHLLISRWPLGGTVLHDISVGRREPRRAIETTVATPFGPLHLISVHLGLSFHERRRQAAMLAEIASRAAGTSVVAGDFNDWLWRGAVDAALRRELPARTWHRTFPAFRPLARLDRLYCRPPEALLRSWTDPLARRASDHLPVIADIAVGA